MAFDGDDEEIETSNSDATPSPSSQLSKNNNRGEYSTTLFFLLCEILVCSIRRFFLR
jgi:hypothetical protein